MANFNWLDADEIWFGNDFVPYFFSFREYRNGNPVMCGELILHSQENMARRTTVSIPDGSEVSHE
ncbi:MAG: hypothetical protein HFF16_10495 [Angelakisella sp.]|nr:hypothetical protein [Angelakisella sp.]